MRNWQAGQVGRQTLRGTATALAMAACVTLLVGGASVVVRAQIAVSSNDNKAVWVNGVNVVPANPKPDTVSVLDLSTTPPRILTEFEAPGGWSAPPQSVAVAPDESIALVVSGAKLDPNDPKKTVFNDVVSVVDLKASPARVIATLQAGRRSVGVSINKAGTMAAVANRAEGTVSIFTIAGTTVTPAGKVDLKQPDSGASLPVFSPDGQHIYVTLNDANGVAILDVNGTTVTYSGVTVPAGLKPYGIELVPDGSFAVVANIGNGPMGGSDTLQLLDLKATPPRVVDGVFVGMVPEGISMAPGGRFVAAALQNGAHLGPNSPYYHATGFLKIYAIEGTRLRFVTQAPLGKWCQGVAWNSSATRVVAQCAADNRIEVFGWDGIVLTRQAPVTVSGAPTGIRTADAARMPLRAAPAPKP